MQSFIQYKKFRHTVEAQVARNAHKSNPANGTEQKQKQQDQLPTDSFSDKDVEKGDSSLSSSDEPKQGLSEADLERNIQDGDTFPQQEEEELEQRIRAQHQHPTEEVEDPSAHDSSDEHRVPESLEHQYSNLSRFSTRRTGMQRTGSALGAVMTGVQIRKRSTKEGGEGDVFIVGYEDEEDTMNPHNWSVGKRIAITFTVSSSPPQPTELYHIDTVRSPR